MSTDFLRAGRTRSGAFVLLFAIAFVSIGGCGYPRVSESALRLAQAIDTVANLRDPAQIPKARKVVEARFSAGEIDESERDMLLSILDQAEEGDWEGALELLEQAVPALEGTYSDDFPYEAYAEYNIGRTLAELGRCDEARPHLDRSKELQGNRPEIRDAKRSCRGKGRD